MKEDIPRYVIDVAKELRKKNTPEESMLWEYIRDNKLKDYKFRRQHPIGRYIADFYCDKARLVIELDGKIHENVDVKEYDQIRQKEIESRNIRVLRFKNEDLVKDINKVIREIEATLNKSP